MKTLYEASNALEAHMILDLLKQEGLTARIHGEYLQGGIGELPAAGLVRVVIDESDYAQARALVERWDAAQPKDSTPKPTVYPSRALYGFLFGLTVGVGGSYAYFQSPVTVDGIDHSGDGALDEKWTYAPSGTLLKLEIDRNRDGKIDYVAHYDRRGIIESDKADANFDGAFESRTRFRAGNAELSEIDTDGDGYPDLRERYVSGALSASEYMNPLTGLPLRIESYTLGKLTTAEVDSNQDGKLDTRNTYNPLGEVRATEKLTK